MNIKLDANGDWDITNNQLQLVTGQDEIAQKISNRLKLFLGEWFLDVRLGVPWFSKILKKNPNPSEIEAILIQQIIETTGVVTLNSIELSLDNATRKLRVEFEAQTTDGILNFSEVVP